MDMTSRVGKRVAEIRRMRGWTQTDLADRTTRTVKWDQPVIARVENAKRRLTLDDVIALAVALNVSPLFLLTPEDPNEPVALAGSDHPAREVRNWIRGFKPLPGADEAEFVKAMPFEDRLFLSDPSLPFLISVTQRMAQAQAEGDAETWNDLVRVHDQVSNEIRYADETTGPPHFFNRDQVLEILDEVMDKISPQIRADHLDRLQAKVAADPGE